MTQMHDAPAMTHRAEGRAVREIYEILCRTYGAETWHWSPDYVRGPLDVMFGAVLVQHTTWRNAERALEQMRDAGALDPQVILAMPDDALLALVRVSGTPTVKLRRLRALARTMQGAGGAQALLALPAADLRARLLATHGIGPETADAILLYAGAKRIFVIDAYTQRLFRRIGLAPHGDSYDAWQRWFHDNLPRDDVAMFQRFHAYIVLHGKAICRAIPRCGACPLTAHCATGRAALASALR